MIKVGAVVRVKEGALFATPRCEAYFREHGMTGVVRVNGSTMLIVEAGKIPCRTLNDLYCNPTEYESFYVGELEVITESE